jgi:hypothetical protein
LPVKIIQKGYTTVNYYTTDPTGLIVSTIPVDTTLAIKPINGPVSAPYTFREILPWLLTGIGLIIIILVLIYFIKYRKKEQKLPWVKPKPKLPAHIQALNDLEKLRLKRLWQSGKVKEYYTELTGILRIYIENRFGINAMELVSSEIIDSLKKINLDSSLINSLNLVLKDADMVKFAKANPLPSYNDKNHKVAEDFVKTTIPSVMNNEGNGDENRQEDHNLNNTTNITENKDNQKNA